MPIEGFRRPFNFFFRTLGRRRIRCVETTRREARAVHTEHERAEKELQRRRRLHRQSAHRFLCLKRFSPKRRKKEPQHKERASSNIDRSDNDCQCAAVAGGSFSLFSCLAAVSSQAKRPAKRATCSPLSCQTLSGECAGAALLHEHLHRLCAFDLKARTPMWSEERTKFFKSVATVNQIALINRSCMPLCFLQASQAPFVRRTPYPFHEVPSERTFGPLM